MSDVDSLTQMEHQPAAALQQLASMLTSSRRCVVLTGAGVSTESGIPDYRDRNGAWKRTPPMQYQEFIGSHAARQRYWARALIGWQQFRHVEPNRAHHALTSLQQAGVVHTIITQNVDGLHQRAGSHDVIDLHGRIDLVECLQCKRSSPRAQMQLQLVELNPHWTNLTAEMAPDGDALLENSDFASFTLPSCEHCAGPLKPAVVFFGESVPKHSVDTAYEAIRHADLLMVVGSSLMVMSGYRFVREARALDIPIGLINLGLTRADDDVAIKVEDSCGQALQWLAATVSRPALRQ
jgi:NAD-dependent SIR2 family protein deacetylase